MADLEAIKKLKKPNFSNSEIAIMPESINESYSVLVSKQQNALTNRRKKAAWMEVANKVNARGGHKRDVSAVKKKWKDLKSQYLSRPRKDSVTGGGKSAEPVPYEDVIAQILGDRSTLNDGIPGAEELDLLWPSMNKPSQVDSATSEPEMPETLDLTASPEDLETQDPSNLHVRVSCEGPTTADSDLETTVDPQGTFADNPTINWPTSCSTPQPVSKKVLDLTRLQPSTPSSEPPRKKFKSSQLSSPVVPPGSHLSESEMFSEWMKSGIEKNKKAIEKHQIEIEKIQAEKEKHLAELEQIQAEKEKHLVEIDKLRAEKDKILLEKRKLQLEISKLEAEIDK